MRLNAGMFVAFLTVAGLLQGCNSGGGTKTGSSATSSTSSGSSGAETESVARPTIVSSAVWKDGAVAGEERSDNGPKIKLLWCPPGKFQMGSFPQEAGRRPDEGPVEVTLSHGFWIGKYEVTQKEWEDVMGENPCKGAHRRCVKLDPDFPVAYLYWKMANEFCQKLTDSERQAQRLPMDWEYALPTEAQWEYACRAGTTTRFSFGDDEKQLGDYAWFGEKITLADEEDGTARGKHQRRVGQKKPNPWGLYDTYGNVWEWCRDSFEPKLPGGQDPLVISDSVMKSARGISWATPIRICRSAARNGYHSQFEHYSVGLRLAAVHVGKK